VAPIGFYNVGRDEATVVFALVSLLAEGHLKLSYMEWRSLRPKKFANYVLCPTISCASQLMAGSQQLLCSCAVHLDTILENILRDKGRCYLAGYDISEFVDNSSSFSFAPAVAKAQCVPELIDGLVTRFDYCDPSIYSLGFSLGDFGHCDWTPCAARKLSWSGVGRYMGSSSTLHVQRTH
jgi:hypothetical protein